MQEVWKDIVGYEGLYQVSNLGRVKSLDRGIKDGRKKTKGRILSQNKNPEGYLHISFSVDGLRKERKVHRVVAENFIPNPQNLSDVNHIDGVKTNNALSNLEWVNRSDNMFHAFNLGLCQNKGEKHTCAKLTEKDVHLIRKLRKEYNLKLKTIADLFNVHRVTIGDIILGRTWTYLKEE